MNFFHSLFGIGPKSLLGIDINDFSINVVEVGVARGGKHILKHAASERLESGLVSDGSITNFDAVSQALRLAVKKSGSKTRFAVMALPSSSVITKRVLLPSGASDDELEVLVESEAGHHIPFPLDEVSLDFCVIDSEKNTSEYIGVLIAASRKEKMQDYQGLAESVGLNTEVMDVVSLANHRGVQRFLRQNSITDKAAVAALLQIGFARSELKVFSHDDVLFERELTFGLTYFVKTITQRYGITSSEALSQNFLQNIPVDYNREILNPFLRSLSQEVLRSLEIFLAGSQYNEVDQILLSGETMLFAAGLQEEISSIVGASCHIINPFIGMDFGQGANLKEVIKNAPAYLTACSLSLRGIKE